MTARFPTPGLRRPPTARTGRKSDLRRRMEFGLRCAYAHGVSAIRSHIDTYHDTAERSWRVLREIREEWRGRIDLQAVALCPIDLMDR